LDNWGKEQIKSIILQGINENIFDNQNGDREVLFDVFIMVLKGLEIPFFLQGKYEQISRTIVQNQLRGT